MHHQEAFTVVALPPAVVESRLAQVEAWPAFLEGVAEMTRVGHERYRCRIEDGDEHREVLLRVHHDHARHCFSWTSLGGPRLRGWLRLEEADTGHTVVRLALEAVPHSLLAGLAEMVAPRRSRAALDVQALERVLTAQG